MINVKDLTFTYKGASEPVLKNLNFSIAEGEVYGLLGPSGSGKSTTQKILMGLLRGFHGSANLFNQPVENIGRNLYERIGVSFELPTLYTRLTALENLKLFAALYNSPTRDPMEVLELVDLHEAANQRVEALSKGMKMRLNLCRSLLHNPDLLFLDEPTTGQDPARARLTRDLIKTLKAEGKTIFLTTHNMSEADEICDRVAFLSRGAIPVSGTPESLKRQYGRRLLKVDISKDDAIQSIEFPMEDIGANADFLSLLATENIASIHTAEASLDDVFIKATSADATTEAA